MSGVVQVSDPALRLLCSIECPLQLFSSYFFYDSVLFHIPGKTDA